MQRLPLHEWLHLRHIYFIMLILTNGEVYVLVSGDKNYEMAVNIAHRVQNAGGRAFFVGGFVRDMLMNVDNKDIDIEVHGIFPKQLEEILGAIGEYRTIGASFGVYNLAHYDIDIAMPRTETQSGRGHRDFQIFVDPFLGTQRAAQRRDFTINAIMKDIISGEIIDHFNGVEDLRRRTIRHVCDSSFVEDQLRVLRAAQFAARFDFCVAHETLQLCSGMELTDLAKERVIGELQKALLKAQKPSLFFEVLRKMGQLSDWFPEVEALIGVQQNPVYHPEGDVYNHTMLVLDRAAELRDKAKNPQALMMSALCHDFGKPGTTELIDGKIRSLGHEELGAEVARKFLHRLTSENELIKYTANMVLLHMRPNALYYMNSGPKAYMRMFNSSVCPEDLLLLARADRLGQGRAHDDYDAAWERLTAELAAYRELMSRPQVSGEELICAGMKPGKELGEALKYSHKLHLSGLDKDRALRQTLAMYNKKRQ